MSTGHDYVGCQEAYCLLCSAYGDGYAAGKAKAHNETRWIAQRGSHAPDCGCEPCKTLQTVVRPGHRAGPREYSREGL